MQRQESSVREEEVTGHPTGVPRRPQAHHCLPEGQASEALASWGGRVGGAVLSR